ncbi:hypothetical protein PRELSG_0209700 [Plasmodium relictum]|uniref:Uncharacterized protein n=1 Tax=Plasmodium relictum TaxID=85471 RepID=A0A1J1HDQ4_PLARL|nr:hypothetical protein PRELSG_0209700 [Plasmodium relictum]CRH03072.1 hypothetical protein PRELSG_0209700 [Plasmodium relictum]
MHSLECFRNKLNLNTLHFFQIGKEAKSKIDDVEVFDDEKEVDEVKKMIYPRIVSYGDFSVDLYKENENYNIEIIELKCNEKYPYHLDHLSLKILKVLMITRTKKVDVSKYFNELCKKHNSCSLSVQLDEERNFVDDKKTIHLKIINDKKKRHRNSNINKLKIFFVCEDLIHHYVIPTKARHVSRYAFSYGKIAYIRCENHKTVRIIKISGKMSNGKFNIISKDEILSYCSQREICKINMLDLYKDHKESDYVFYEVKYACRIPQVCRLCSENSTCELDKIFNKNKDVIQFENNLNNGEDEVFNRLLPKNEDEAETEEEKKKINIKNLEYNPISFDSNHMVSVGNNAYHIYEICKCKKGFLQEGLLCFKNENQDKEIEKENHNDEKKENIILDNKENQREVINEERVNNNNVEVLENENIPDEKNMVNEKINNHNKVDIEDPLNDEKEKINNPEEIQENNNDFINDDNNININEIDEDLSNSKEIPNNSDQIKEDVNFTLEESYNNLKKGSKINTEENLDKTKVEPNSIKMDSFSILNVFQHTLFLLFFVSFF